MSNQPSGFQAAFDAHTPKLRVLAGRLVSYIVKERLFLVDKSTVVLKKRDSSRKFFARMPAEVTESRKSFLVEGGNFPGGRSLLLPRPRIAIFGRKCSDKFAQ